MHLQSNTVAAALGLALLVTVQAQCNMADHSTCMGYIHNGTTTGKEVKLGGLNVYLSLPKATASKASPVVLLYTDIYGWQLPNIRLWSDALARDGFVSLVPDFFKNNSWSPARAAAGENIMGWFALFPDAQVLNETQAVYADLGSKQAQYNITLSKFGTEGFCWGGRYVVLANSGSPALADAGVVFHGARVTHELVAGITTPVLFEQSDPAVDSNFDATVYAQVQQILAAKNASGVPTGIEFYPNQPHGYALRGDSNNTATATAAAEAYDKGAAWLKKYLA